MYQNRWIIFLADKNGRQIYHVCPFILRGFWEAYRAKLPDESRMDILLQWVDTVPPNLRKKIIIHKGNFFNFNSLKGTQAEGITQIENTGILGAASNFNPHTWIEQITKFSNKSSSS